MSEEQAVESQNTAAAGNPATEGEVSKPDQETAQGEGTETAGENAAPDGESAQDEDPDQKLIDEQISAVADHFAAADYTLEQGEEGTPAILHLLDADGNEITSGPLHELVDRMKLEQAATDNPLPAAPRPKAGEKPTGEMKIRWIPFDRRKVLRVIQPFEQDGVKYEPGDIFDWAALGMKPYFVNRLYNRKVVRHIVEDSRVSYPFRAERKPAGNPKASEAPEGGDNAQNASTGAETGENPATDETKKEGSAKDGRQPAKFTKKNAARRK